MAVTRYPVHGGAAGEKACCSPNDEKEIGEGKCQEKILREGAYDVAVECGIQRTLHAAAGAFKPGEAVEHALGHPLCGHGVEGRVDDHNHYCGHDDCRHDDEPFTGDGVQ